MTKHVFLSFVAEDLNLVNLFRGQAKNQKSDLSFDDYSVKQPYNSANAAYIRAQITEKIRSASVTLCLIGPHTARSAWVEWEIRKSYELGNKVLGVNLSSAVPATIPSALRERNALIYGWDIAAIVRAIG